MSMNTASNAIICYYDSRAFYALKTVLRCSHCRLRLFVAEVASSEDAAADVLPDESFLQTLREDWYPRTTRAGSLFVLSSEEKARC